MDKVNIYALYIGLGLGLVFVIYGFLIQKSSRPQLNQVITVILSGTGAVVGIHLGYLSLTLEDEYLGLLSDQRVAISLGSLAVIWTAIETIFTIFKSINAEENVNLNDRESIDKGIGKGINIDE